MCNSLTCGCIAFMGSRYLKLLSGLRPGRCPSAWSTPYFLVLKDATDEKKNTRFFVLAWMACVWHGTEHCKSSIGFFHSESQWIVVKYVLSRTGNAGLFCGTRMPLELSVGWQRVQIKSVACTFEQARLERLRLRTKPSEIEEVVLGQPFQNRLLKCPAAESSFLGRSSYGFEWNSQLNNQSLCSSAAQLILLWFL